MPSTERRPKLETVAVHAYGCASEGGAKAASTASNEAIAHRAGPPATLAVVPGHVQWLDTEDAFRTSLFNTTST